MFVYEFMYHVKANSLNDNMRQDNVDMDWKGVSFSMRQWAFQGLISTKVDEKLAAPCFEFSASQYETLGY